MLYTFVAYCIFFFLIRNLTSCSWAPVCHPTVSLGQELGWSFIALSAQQLLWLKSRHWLGCLLSQGLDCGRSLPSTHRSCWQDPFPCRGGTVGLSPWWRVAGVHSELLEGAWDSYLCGPHQRQITKWLLAESSSPALRPVYSRVSSVVWSLSRVQLL